jgi:serine/threonine protein kinase/Tol biopolymer transport system component
LAELLADGGPVDWAELLRTEPDLAAAVARFRELQALSSAHETSARDGDTGPTLASAREVPSFTWGAIQVFEKLGEGGFAEVYRAWDPTLERAVALKLSRSDAQQTAVGIQQWLDEARRLAKVRHPNVVVIHGVDVRDGRAGFWTDLIGGRTLEKVLKDQGRFGGAEAALVGLDLCRALAAVHAAGLVHGDLKASNVMREGSPGGSPRTGAGRVVLMDFGASGDSSPPVSRSAKFVTPLATAPEVMRGEPPSRQSDFYSLGVLLFRLVTGRHPIESSDPAELEAKIQYGLRTPLRDLRPDLGAALVAAVERALDPDPARRFASAGEMERALSEALSEERPSAAEASGREASVAPSATGSAATLRKGVRPMPLGVGIIAVAVALVAIAWWIGSRTPTPHESIRFTITGPPGKLIRTDPNNFAISPDGSTLAFIAYDSTGQSLWVRRLGNYRPREIAGTRGSEWPFWSPDGKQVGFFSDGKMRRVGLDGGVPQVICDAPKPHGASWSRQGIIVFSPGDANLFRVPASGGTPDPVTTIDTTGGADAHAWPGFLPDGEHFTYIARRNDPYEKDDPPRAGLWTSYVGSIRSKRSQPLLEANSVAMYAPPHHVIYIRNGVLYAQNFDMRRLRVTDRPIPIADSPAPVTFIGSKCGSVSANGVLVWASGGDQKNQLAWIDRSGRRIRDFDVLPDRWSRATISPDGRRAILRKAEEDGGTSLWLLDLEGEALTQLVSGTNFNDFGAWSHDSKEILFSRRGREGVCEVHRMAVDPPESDTVVYRSDGQLQNAFGWSPDGRWMLVQEMRPGTNFDLLLVPARGGVPRTFAATRFAERRAQISPDGRWALYLTNESGSIQACVQSFPRPGRKHLVSPLPVFYATWCAKGREIVLVARDYRILSVPVEGGDELRLGTPHELFQATRDARWLAPAPDGQRFLLVEPDPAIPERSIQVNVNWTAGLRQ